MTVMLFGWMSEAERLALRRWAFGLDVLELGCYEGLSTAQLLTTAKSVHAVDTFDGRGTPLPRDTKDKFHANMRGTGLYNKLATWPGEFAEVLPKMKERGHDFDLIFIDGAHDYSSVMDDVAGSIPLLREGGSLVFHDHDQDHPGVVMAVEELCAKGWHFQRQENSLVMLKLTPQPEPKKIKVAGLFPHRDGWGNIGSAWSMDSWMSQKYNRQVYNRGTSILTRTFNSLFCEALNDRESMGFTHVAMLHNDVIPDRFWLDVLVEELESRDLDMLSVVVPIKDAKGLTSTGIDLLSNPWSVRRLTMKEIYDLPETFVAADIPFHQGEQALLLNTGCWLMRLDQPWRDGLEFRQQDRIAFHTPSGKFVAQSISEDWDFSRQLHSRGCRLGATRKVGVIHDNAVFHNRSAWGEWETDRDYIEEQKKAAEYEMTLVTAAPVS